VGPAEADIAAAKAIKAPDIWPRPLRPGYWHPAHDHSAPPARRRLWLPLFQSRCRSAPESTGRAAEEIRTLADL